MKQKTKILHFPKGFLWGAATSAYQVEGGITNNDWETQNRLPKAGLACDHYRRYEEDFKLAKKLNQNAHRLSLEWARIEPQKNEWDEEALHHYYHVLKFLKEQGFKTFVTLHHFTNPVWVADQGGWVNKTTIQDFQDYAGKVAQSLGQYIDYWITVNEPNLYADLGYLTGKFPPFKRSLLKAQRVYKNLLRAHNKVYQMIHAYYPEAQVGFAQNFPWRKASRRYNIFDQLAVRVANWIEYDYPYGRTKNDFIGVNHYSDTHLKVTFNPARGFIELHRHPGEASDRDWPIHAHAIYQVLLKLKTLQKPVYITENGLADAEDKQRGEYLREYLIQIHRAIKAGVDIRGYLHWSLMDNFEWEDGYRWKFGLLEVNFKTQKRKIRKSALYYARICKNNELTLG